MDSDLPEKPTSPVEVMEVLDRFGSPATVASTGGRFFGLVVGGTLPAALGARILASAWVLPLAFQASEPAPFA
jgi:hypothetical protein